MTTPKLTPSTTPTVVGEVTLSSPERCKLLLDRLARHHRETHALEETTSDTPHTPQGMSSGAQVKRIRPSPLKGRR